VVAPAEGERLGRLGGLAKRTTGGRLQLDSARKTRINIDSGRAASKDDAITGGRAKRSASWLASGANLSAQTGPSLRLLSGRLLASEGAKYSLAGRPIEYFVRPQPVTDWPARDASGRLLRFRPSVSARP